MFNSIVDSPIGDLVRYGIDWLATSGAEILRSVGGAIHRIAEAPMIIPISFVILAIFLFFSKTALAKFLALPYIFLRRILRLTGVVNDHRTWGVVYDAATKQPIDPAYISIVGKLGTIIATAITDLDGRFGIVVPQGTYTLKVEKTNYAFPSEKLRDKHSDGYFTGLYFGAQFEVTDSERSIAFAVPMDSVGKDWNQQEKERKHMNAHDHKEIRLAACIYFLIAGVYIYTQYIVLHDITHNYLLWVYTGILFIGVLYAIFVPHVYYHGIVLDKSTSGPIGFARIKVYKYESHIQVATKITSLNGQFVCLVPNGQYYLTVEKRNDGGLYTLAYTSAPFRVVDRSINRQFMV